MKNRNIKEARTFDELLDLKYGKVGTAKRNKFEEKAQKFVTKQTKIKEK